MASTQTKGKIGVTTENIFPVIKQFLYSDKDIFIREIVANAVDATQKIKALASSGDFKGDLGNTDIRIELDEEKKILKVRDSGVGMTEEEVDRYINQIAFSSAGEFLEKYKDQIGSIIGHFGLGFYSAFMVSKKVTIDTLSWKEGAAAVKWTCDGSPEYKMGESTKKTRGTVITMYLDDDCAEYASRTKIQELLHKYCKFMPVKIIFGKEQEWKDGKYVDTDKDNVINNIEPIWTKAPADLKEEDYMKFYRDLYPTEEDPMFYIHLNVDYPFNLTGVLYFPKIKERMAIDKHKIQLYCNQMFVTDHVDNIVPDFLTLLHGVIDSPDIPLNVSRSYLQSDRNVKMISTYITRKVADRLEEIFKEQRAQLEEKWDNIKLFIEYGMLSDEKFGERGVKFALLKNTEGKYFSLDEYKNAVAPTQTDKDKKVVFLYATNLQEQYSRIEQAKNLGYDVLLLDCELDSHFVNLLEQKMEDCRFCRVDSDNVENLIPKQEEVKPEMSEEDKKTLDELFKSVLPAGNDYYVEARNLGEQAAPVTITQSEFMRRFREMSALSGGMNYYKEMPEAYNIIVNMQNPVIARIWADRENNGTLLKQVADLALLENGMLKGKDLADFIARSRELLK
ncbi:MAG: molecular chaperone HtpG [Bacteroidales bacterium]|nr:molecular chaperone HtpG [Bacteroidales bacterium]MBQ3985162.1 molecular chaperone HtpG [Bacteroidales bacterium]MBQ4189617.1 molecular chaperone HtpG [Bacteroidales bacterium]